ncbi:MAG TPA: glycoside hydrolase family 32 protein [Corynebacterium xerosis]|uniref:glycoside hydrolase family 32 protein n=1 Tax=Corynebacterium xerosis TaxID=1725 RepID=UPI001D522D05|nr:glycoside hydrolase family 32 protein [Corynebacterium xerosis]HJG58185.1 glycoside hydrolase family 32 protein [Corynebacterium xerosis]
MAGNGHRPAFHLAPPKGRLNDPNGLVHLDGTWHVCYQWDPGFPHAPRRTGWGYATSPDLLEWRHHPPMLAPGEEYDADGCFSGGAVAPQRPGDPVEFFYTGNLPGPAALTGAELAQRFPDGIPVGHVWGATQCLATTAPGPDGILRPAVKDAANPLVAGPPPGYTAHYRDPVVTADPDVPGQWRMLLGAQTDDRRGTALLHYSTDRRRWDRGREIVLDGPTPGGYMWECPNLLRMTDAATGVEYDVLIVSPQGIRAEDGDERRNRYQCGYVVGHLLADDAGAPGPLTFRVTEPFRELDHGFEFYAPQAFAGTGRHVLLGWMGMPEEDDQPTMASGGWLHCLTFARELTLHEGRLIQTPIVPGEEAMPTVGDGHRGDIFRVALTGDGAVTIRDSGGTGGQYGAGGTGGLPRTRLDVELRGDRLMVRRHSPEWPNHFGDERATTLPRRRRGSGTHRDLELGDHGDADDGNAGHGKAGTIGGGGHRVDILADHSAVEIVADDGAAIFSLRLFGLAGPWEVSSPALRGGSRNAGNARND